MRSERAVAWRATLWGLFVAGLVLVGIYAGSRELRDFDPALVAYAGASVFCAFGLAYRYAMWLSRPPTRLYWRRGWQTFLTPSRLPKNVAKLFPLFWNNIVAQRFIEKRSHARWFAHLFIAWGCLLAAAVTFPLSWGWIHFESAPEAPGVYQAFVFGVKVLSFPLSSPLAPLVFNVLDIAAVMVLIGVGIALYRRGRDRGALAVQQFESDLLPLMLLFAVSVTGLFLTLSTHLMKGIHYGFLSELHAVTVIFTLLYLPFGKFFHVFQRPAQLSIKFYKEAGEEQGNATCSSCGEPFATALQIVDLKNVQNDLGIGYAQDQTHYQDICPACRRKSLAVTQDRLWRKAHAGARR